jgi:nucleoside-diphosphate-sugar epimerase
MNVLITGGTGFIGSRLALRCLEQKLKVRVIGQENTDAERENKVLIISKGAEIVSASVTDRKSVFAALDGIDIVYHLAAAQHEANVPDQVFWDVNVTGTKNVLEGSVNTGVKNFIHGSTIGVYGSGAEGQLNEQSTVRPDNIYGKTKLEGEKVVLAYKERLHVVIIRISETYGPGDRRLLKLFKAILKNVFFVIGNGRNKHHLIYIDDLINGFFLCTDTPEANGETFILTGRDILNTNEMVNVIAETLGQKPPKFHTPFLPFLWIAIIMETVLPPFKIQPPLHRRRLDFFKKNLYFSNDKAKNLLNFHPEYSFIEGARQTADWYAQKRLL